MLMRTGQVLLFSAVLLAANAAMADPVSGLLGLLLAEKVGGKEHPVDSKPRPWQDNLSSRQLSMLNQLRNHAAISTCMQMADAGNPVASYQLSKISALGVRLQRSIDASSSVPDVRTLAWQRPAKALRWCARQAGLSDDDAPLSRYAYGIVRLVRAQAVESHMVAAQ